MAKEYSYGIIPYIFTENGIKILLIKSSKNSKEWNFIKGKIENNETILNCIGREVFEEIGIIIDNKDLDINYGMIKQNSKRKNIVLFFINWDKYQIKKYRLSYNEVYQINFFNINNLPLISKNQRKIVTEIHKRFNKYYIY